MKKDNALTIFVFSLLILIFPLIYKDTYLLTIGIFIGINALVAIGLTILMGYAGQISIGQAGFYGIGAYVSAILSLYFGLPVLLSMLLAIVVACIVSIFIAIPALRLKGHYLAVATLGFGEIVYLILNEWGPGGPSGFGDIPRISLFGYTFTTSYEYFYFVWSIVIIVMIFSFNLINSMTGKALKAIHGSETASATVGINIVKLKIKVFILSAFYASMAGAIYAHYVTFLSPSSFSLFYSVMVLMMVVVGGISNLWGGVVGAFIITILPELLRGFKELDVLVYGIILTIALLFVRKGFVPLILEGYRRWLQK
ncbi:MAG: branched-chain amino acid ABC transporter permease [Thermodesulfovibrio sp.]|nr:branched-chain amino acid ABC transporter permease [Thermodesulfovibrio sp.]